MVEIVHQFIEWISRRWHAAGWPMRGGYVALLVALLVGISVVTPLVPGFNYVKDLFARASPESQTAILVLLILAVLAAGVVGLQRDHRVTELKGKNAQLAVRAEAAEAENRLHQERLNRMLDVESRAGIWQRPSVVLLPPFVPRSQRKTRFVTVLNLKGGVGKTTLTANLAACLARGPEPRRVLLIDLDFQGTLGDATVEQSLIELQRQHGAFVDLMLSAAEPDGGLATRLAVPMAGVPTARVILAVDTLDSEEFQAQARFFVDPAREPRYRFREHLHHPSVFDAFDLVLFDSPPRVTISTVNALACSDHVLIPTRLDGGSVDAVPRTISWLKSLGPHRPAEVVGVVASHATIRDKKMVRGDQQSYEKLRELVRATLGGADRTFRAVVPSSPRAVPAEQGRVAALGEEGRLLYQPVADELSQKVYG